ncbi:MAG: helix-turn-helix transcriptional regulator [Clostridia bacterium]|nr:helix-turn-helix transcriptional regulator [Clostridia bacterium]
MNSIGERIYELRKKNNMSQGDLADRLDVSRQTVSKWENNSSVPELEKISHLSEIFSVTTDYIIKGKDEAAPVTKACEEQPEPVYVYVHNTGSEAIVRKYVGIVLAVIFALITVLLIIIGGEFYAVGTGGVAVLGLLLALNTKHPYLIASWITYIATIIILPFFTSISPFLIFDPTIYTEGYLVHFIITYSIWIIFFALILRTAVIIRKNKKKRI